MGEIPAGFFNLISSGSVRFAGFFHPWQQGFGFVVFLARQFDGFRRADGVGWIELNDVLHPDFLVFGG